MNVNHVPLELQRKHLTKVEIEERKNRELKTEKLTKVPSCPSYLNDNQKKIFKKVCKQLIEVNILTALDVDTVARYAIASDLYQEITERINNNMELLLDSKIMNTQSKLHKQLSELSNALCLNIVARSKIVVDNTSKEVPVQNKFSKFIRSDANE